MSESGLTPQEHFIKQRRNLVLISVFLILINLGGVEFNNLSILGNTATVKNPNLFYYMILISSLYLLWRYNTAFNLVDGNNKLKELQDNYFEMKKEAEYKNKIIKELQDENRDENDIDDLIYLGKYVLNRLNYQTKGKSKVCFYSNGNYNLYTLAKRLKLEEVNHSEDHKGLGFIDDLDDAEINKIKRFMLLKASFHYPEFSEYIFPFFLFGISLGTIISRFTLIA